jgi:RNA polymerase sigma-70 factor (ECF subfamily)
MVAKHRVADYWRKKIAREQYEPPNSNLVELLADQVVMSENLDKEYSNEERLHWIHKTINTLPENLRLVFVLHFIENMTYEEIAEILRIHKNTVKYRIKRVKSILSQKADRISRNR